MYTFLTVLHVIVCLFLILSVLLQAGKGGGMGIGFGSSGSQTVFGSGGAGNILTKATAVAATIFFANSLLLAYMSSQSDSRRLQQLAEKKASQKKGEDAAKAKVVQDLQKARESIEKGITATGAAGGTAGPAAVPAAAGGAPGTAAPPVMAPPVAAPPSEKK